MQSRKHYIDMIFIIVLIGVFAVSSVTLAILGVNTYKDIAVKNSQQNLNTASLYFVQKIRQCDSSSSVHIDVISDDIPALVIESHTEGQDLETWLFVYKNYLKEISAVKGSDISAEFGQQIVPLKSVSFTMVENDLLKVNLKPEDGKSSTVNLHISDSFADAPVNPSADTLEGSEVQDE